MFLIERWKLGKREGRILFAHCMRVGGVVLFLTAVASPGPLWAQSPQCYTTGDGSYAAHNGLTVCHTPTSAEEGTYYSTPAPSIYVTFGQIAYNAQPIRLAPGSYATLVHLGPAKQHDSSVCPLTTSSGGMGIGYPGHPSPETTPFPYPSLVDAVVPNPLYEYSWCDVGDSIGSTTYTATGISDTVPYTIAGTPSYVLTGTYTNPLAGNFYGATTGTSTLTLSSPLTAGTPYTEIPVNATPFPLSGFISLTAYTTTLSIGSGGQQLSLVPFGVSGTGGATETASVLTSGGYYTSISLGGAGLPYAVAPGTGFNLGSNGVQVTASDVATQLSSALTSGSMYTSVPVSALPYAIANGTVLPLHLGTVPGVAPQQVTLTSRANAGATSISVSTFTANYSYPIGTYVDIGMIPKGATKLPVLPFVASARVPSGTQLVSTVLPQGSTQLTVASFTPSVTYPAGTTLTLLADHQEGGAANPMTVAGRYYFPNSDSYYYTFFIGERRVDPSAVCPWRAAGGPCGWHELLLEARTIDFINWQVYTNKPSSSGGPWVNFADLNSTYYPIPVPDRNGTAIESNYPDGPSVSGLLGSVDQVYTSVDGVHTFRYFYSDHPAATSSTSWKSDLQIFNLYERDASTDDSGSFDSTGNIVWSAPKLVATNVPGGGLLRIAKAHGLNRWIVAWPDALGDPPPPTVGTPSTSTTDYRVELSADMTGLAHADWLAPLTHLMNGIQTNSGVDYLNVQTGRSYGAGYVEINANGKERGYTDVIAQPDFMTDRDGNITAPDNGSPGYTRGGMLTWTDFPAIYDNTQTAADDGGNLITALGGWGGPVEQATFDVSGNIVGDLATNGDFATGVFTGNATYDGWTMIDESLPGSGGGTNYQPVVLNSGLLPNGQVADVGPANLSAPESVGGSGMYQSITLPSTATTATLSFSYWNQCAAGGGDNQSVYIYNADTAVFTPVIAPACDNSQTWKSETYDLSSMIGHTLWFIFQTRKVNTSNTAAVGMLVGCENACFSVDVE
jgi:hypothetical protein